MIAIFLIAGAALLSGETGPAQLASELASDGKAEIAAPAQLLNLGETFTPDDYPLEALRRNETGTAASILAINKQGRVTHCQIETSSGSNELDTQTCRLYRDRARFEPARDRRGRKIASSIRQRTRWQIPGRMLPPLADGHARLAITFAKDGTISGCRFELISVAITTSQDCLYDSATKEMLVARFKDAVPLRGKTLVQESYLIVDDKPLPGFGNGPGEMLRDRNAIEMTIGVDGKPTNCWVIERSDDNKSGEDPCVKCRNMLFGKLPAEDTRKLPINVRIVTGSFTRP